MDCILWNVEKKGDSLDSFEACLRIVFFAIDKCFHGNSFVVNNTTRNRLFSFSISLLSQPFDLAVMFYNRFKGIERKCA